MLSLSLTGAQGPSEQYRTPKEIMVEEMRNTVAQIAEDHGNIPFGFVFTNDPEIGAVIQRNVKIIENSLPLEGLVNDRLQALEEVNAKISTAEAQFERMESEARRDLERKLAFERDQAQSQLNRVEASAAEARRELERTRRSIETEKSALESGLATVREQVEAEKGALSAELASMREDMRSERSALNEELDAVRRQIAEERKALAVLEAEKETLEGKIEPMRGVISAMSDLLGAYDTGESVDSFAARHTPPPAPAPEVEVIELAVSKPEPKPEPQPEALAVPVELLEDPAEEPVRQRIFRSSNAFQTR